MTKCPTCDEPAELMPDDDQQRAWCDACRHVFDPSQRPQRHLAAVAAAYEPRPRKDLDLE